MVKVVITAPRGAMDSLIVQEAFKNDNIEVVGCVGTPGADYIGRDAGQVCGLIHEIKTCRELIAGTCAEAEAILRAPHSIGL